MTAISNPSDRHRQILELIVAKGQVYVPELATLLKVTSETIRRDLSQLAAQNLLKKVHGGAIDFNFNAGLESQLKFEHAFLDRVKLAENAKKSIAQKACTLISEGDTLFIDFGTSTLEFARALIKINHLTVISNSPLIADILQANPTIEVILLGGQFIASKFECLGAITLQNAAQFFADYAVIGAGAIHQDKGFMDQDVNEAAIAKKMIENSGKTIVLADASKAGNQALSLVANWDAVDFLVTNENSKHWKNESAETRHKILIAGV